MTTTFKVVEIYRNNSASQLDQSIATTDQNESDANDSKSAQIFNLLGFNLIGGYLTDLPITITDIANENGKHVKVEEGDTILEINGISTRHMTLNEVYKQLRCCGNRIYLKIKSDLEYKSKFKQIIISTGNIKHANINGYNNLIRNASKSFDNNINNQTSSLNLCSSTISSNVSSAANSHSNILDTSDSNSINKSPSKSSSLTTLTLLNSNKDESSTQSASISSNSSNSPVSSTESSSSSSHPESLDLTQITLNNISPSEHVYDNNNCLIPNVMPSTDNQIIPTSPVLTFQIEIDDTIKKQIDEKLKECSSLDSDSDTEVQVYTPKGVDLPSAQRLAKRLYYLDGFKLSDVVRHLSKKNDFSSLVAEEYLKLFNFQSLTLDAALRKFLKQFQLVGDAQEKERVLMYFAKRYVDANNTTFTDVDSCHTLTCAIMLLNTDLHDPKVTNKMTLNEFIENLKGLNNGFNFTDILLESLYSAIKTEPLEYACMENDDLGYEDRNGGNGLSSSVNGNFTLRPIGSNPFLQMPDPQTAKEYKFGWLLRKCCIDSDGKKAPFLKRSWKMFYASLRDMVLYLHKDDKVFKNNTFDNITNAIRIHHAYASVATDYKKKQFVFRLKTADWAEYLFQTSNSNELYDWVSSINLVSAMFSSPPLPGGIGSNKTFQRPLLPVSKTRYTLQEQYEYHKKHLKQLQSDLARLESAAGAFNNNTNNNNNSNTSSTNLKIEEKFFDKEKYTYLQFEIQRYTVYANMLEDKIIGEQQATNPSLNLHHGSRANTIINPSFVLNDFPLGNTNSHYTSHHVFNVNSSQVGSSIYLNDSPTKSMPATPTHFPSPLKNHNQPSLHVNFNISPTRSDKGILQEHEHGSVSVSPTTTTPTTTSTLTANTPTLNAKKFNNYLD